jgi:hypothetical protein
MLHVYHHYPTSCVFAGSAKRRISPLTCITTLLVFVSTERDRIHTKPIHNHDQDWICSPRSCVFASVLLATHKHPQSG